MRLSKPVLLVIGVIACALVAFAAVKGVRLLQDGKRVDKAASSIAINTAGADLGGPFTLVGVGGRTVTDRDFRGRYMLLYFGYSYCPDVCPTELQMVGRALDMMGPAAQKIVPIFVSVDPARDTPEELAKYVKAFYPRMIGLTGTRAEIDKVTGSYHAYYKIGKPSKPGAKDYLVNHTAFLYLVGPDGKLRTMYRGGANAEQLSRALKAQVD